jgi:hypothetical protein
MSWKDKEYDVGFCKPPNSGQFKKGKSGNPKGRPKGTRNFSTDLDEVLSGKVTVVENGTRKKVSVQMATIKRLGEKALMGDLKSMVLLLGLAEQSANAKEAQSAEKAIGASDQQIIDNFIDVLQSEKTTLHPDDGESSNDA